MDLFAFVRHEARTIHIGRKEITYLSTVFKYKVVKLQNANSETWLSFYIMAIFIRWGNDQIIRP